MPNEASSLTKATYDKKRTRRPVPSPERRKVAVEQTTSECAKTRKFNKLPEAKRISTLVALAVAMKE